MTIAVLPASFVREWHNPFTFGLEALVGQVIWDSSKTKVSIANTSFINQNERYIAPTSSHPACEALADVFILDADSAVIRMMIQNKDNRLMMF